MSEVEVGFKSVVGDVALSMFVWIECAGSIFRYGSNFWIVTLNPLDKSNRARDEEIMPFPSDETTPPVTKMYLVSTNEKV